MSEESFDIDNQIIKGNQELRVRRFERFYIPIKETEQLNKQEVNK